MPQSDVITIVCAFTRPWAIEQWLADLAAVEHTPELTNLCFIVDCDEPVIKHALERYAKTRPYRAVHVQMNHKWEVPPETSMGMRRRRIADVKEQSKAQVRQCDGEFVIGLEDDTVFGHIGSFDSLLRPFRELPNVGFVEGVQMGRHGKCRMVGAWSFDDANDPRYCETMLPLLKREARPYGFGDYQRITAGGWYCYATRRNLYLGADYYASANQPWGPDVNFGLWLTRTGYVCLIDWAMTLGHNDRGNIGYADKWPLSQVMFTKDPQTGYWARKDIDEAASRY